MRKYEIKIPEYLSKETDAWLGKLNSGYLRRLIISALLREIEGVKKSNRFPL